jgi:uncharacterized protein (DUF1015 family)
MADVQPFRAVRYAGAAGALADLVAPPYDAVGVEERTALYTRSPFNVVHVTLPDSAERAGELYREWLSSGILELDDSPASWVVAETFVGPDEVRRERRGIIASVEAEPYEAGGVLPHERTHPRIRDERLSLLRETAVQPEPILVLAEGGLDVQPPARAADLEVDGTRLWRRDAGAPLAPGALLVADGHHRYEAAATLGQEQGSPARIMALLVATTDPGLQVFPTHRIFSGRPDLREPGAGERCAGLEEAVDRLAAESPNRAAAVAYRSSGIELLHGAEGELDVELVDRCGLDGISYTQRATEAAEAVDRGEADAAFLVRAPRVADVFAVARRGERMPPKSTYFFPKPLSGILFHPLAGEAARA